MGGDSGMDIRLPMGLMFSIIGAIIAGYGFHTRDRDIYELQTFGWNVNLIWGAVMLAFGLFLLLLTMMAANRRRAIVVTGDAATPDSTAAQRRL